MPEIVSEHIKALLGTLNNPRYVTEDRPDIAPIEFDGIFNGTRTTFVAHPNDVMEYGREIWKAAQQGKYGRVGLFAPSLDTLRKHTKGWAGIVAYDTVKTIGLGDTVKVAVLELAPVITARGDPAPGSLMEKRVKRGASLWGVSPEKWPQFVRDIDEFRFSIVELLAALKSAADAATDKVSLRRALTIFEDDLFETIRTYNATNPPHRVPDPVKVHVPGLGP